MNELIVSKIKSKRQERKNPTLMKAAKALLVALFFILVIIALAKFDLSKVQALVDQHQNFAFLISLAVIFFAFLTFIPTIPLTLLITALIGPFPATIITSLGTTLAAHVHYQIGKQIGDIFNFEQTRTRLPFQLGTLPVNSPLFLMIGRAIPGGPIGLSFVCGAYAVPHGLYFWTTFLTNILGAAIIAYGGHHLIQL